MAWRLHRIPRSPLANASDAGRGRIPRCGRSRYSRPPRPGARPPIANARRQAYWRLTCRRVPCSRSDSCPSLHWWSARQRGRRRHCQGTCSQRLDSRPIRANRGALVRDRPIDRAKRELQGVRRRVVLRHRCARGVRPPAARRSGRRDQLRRTRTVEAPPGHEPGRTAADDRFAVSGRRKRLEDVPARHAGASQRDAHSRQLACLLHALAVRGRLHRITVRASRAPRGAGQDLAGSGVDTCHVVFGRIDSEYFQHNAGVAERVPGIAATIRTLTVESARRCSPTSRPDRGRSSCIRSCFGSTTGTTSWPHG